MTIDPPFDVRTWAAGLIGVSRDVLRSQRERPPVPGEEIVYRAGDQVVLVQFYARRNAIGQDIWWVGAFWEPLKRDSLQFPVGANLSW